MKPSVKFIHTADIHLGSRLQLNETNSKINENYEGAVYNSFKKIIDDAISNDVYFVIIAGDLFDNESRSVKATRFFIEQCERLENNDIELFLINGNHDPYKKEGELFNLPANVKIFDTENVETFKVVKNDKLIARIVGQSYRGSSESRKMITYYTTSDQNVFNIGLLHTQLDPNNHNYVPVSKKELIQNEHIDYWALGHVHKKQIINDHIPYIIYPGIPQGRDIGESGIGGYYLVNLEPENTYYEFNRTSDYIYKKIVINLEEMEEDTLSELNYYLKEKINDLYHKLDKEVKGYILRLILEGKTKIYDLFKEQPEEVTEDILYNLRSNYYDRTPFLWINSISNRTSKKVDNLEEIIKEDRFINEFISFVKNIKNNKKQVEKIKQDMGDIWDPIVDKENIDLEKFQITKEDFDDLFKQAKNEIITEFVERREF